MSERRSDVIHDIAIIGGGFSGLTLAFRLMQGAPDHRVVLLEASDRLGGKALTEIVETEHGRFLIEAGPDSFLAVKPWAGQLAADLGLAPRLLPINMVDRPVSVLKRGNLIRMPAGLSLAAPAALKPFVSSPLLTPSGRARVLREPRIRPSRDDGDETVGSFVRRRLGAEMLDWVAEPLMAGIYNGDPKQMSLLATFPQLRVQERLQGGLIRAARHTRATRVGSRQPAFLTFRDGIGTLVDALVVATAPVARTHATATAIHRASDAEGVFQIELANGERIEARQAVLAIPAHAAAALLDRTFPEVSARLSAFRTNPAGSVSLAFRTKAIARPLPGYGLLVPMKENRPINAVTIASRKFDERAPAGWTLLRVFFGGARSPETMELPDDELLTVVLAELHELLGIASKPLFHRIVRWPSGSPQYDLGHLDRVTAIEGALPSGLHISGCAYRGVGLPDLAKEAALLANQLLLQKPRILKPMKQGSDLR